MDDVLTAKFHSAHTDHYVHINLLVNWIMWSSIFKSDKYTPHALNHFIVQNIPVNYRQELAAIHLDSFWPKKRCFWFPEPPDFKAGVGKSSPRGSDSCRVLCLIRQKTLSPREVGPSGEACLPGRTQNPTWNRPSRAGFALSCFKGFCCSFKNVINANDAFFFFWLDWYFPSAMQHECKIKEDFNEMIIWIKDSYLLQMPPCCCHLPRLKKSTYIYRFFS